MAEAKQIKIGWGIRDISTNEPVNLTGQFHRRTNQGVADPLYGTVLVLDNGDDYVVFVTCDVVSIYNLVYDLKAEMKTLCPEIDFKKVILGATHTHTGPSCYDDPPGTDENVGVVLPGGVIQYSAARWRRWAAKEVAKAVKDAWDTRAPGKIAYGYGFAVVAHSRRVWYFDDISKRPDAPEEGGFTVNGRCKMYGNTRDDNFSHYEAGADHFANFLYTYDTDDKLTGAIINIPCPSQNSEMEYKMSADYWADVRNAIHKKYGNIFILPQCAPAGDLSPRILHYKEAQDRRFRLKYPEEELTEHCARKDIAERIEFAFTETLSWAQKEKFSQLPVKHVSETLYLSRREITEEEKAIAEKGLARAKAMPIKTDGTEIERTEHNSLITTLITRNQRVLERYEAYKKDPKYPMDVHAVRIGDVAFASNHPELYSDYMHRIQARSPFAQTFVIQICANEPSPSNFYLPTERATEGKGYGAEMFSNPVSPKGGQELVEGTLRMLNEIAD